MKFCKKYEEYMAGRKDQKELPVVNLKKLKKVLKRCRRECLSEGNKHGEEEGAADAADRCPVCDGTFFPSLAKEMSEVVGCFNEKAKKLLELHLATGFRKYYTSLARSLHHRRASPVEEGQDLVSYAVMNSIALKKIVKKYDKIHFSKQGQAFRSRAQVMHLEVLHSPWLCELVAFYINTRAEKKPGRAAAIPAFLEDCSLVTTSDGDDGGGKPVISCGLFDSVKLNIDLTCSICLETVFDPISLTCGHIFCYMCACGAASVTIVDGLKAADPRAKCPLCRQSGVYQGAVHLDELNILLHRNCVDYYEQRLHSERAERVRQAKLHWEAQCRAFVGF